MHRQTAEREVETESEEPLAKHTSSSERRDAANAAEPQLLDITRIDDTDLLETITNRVEANQQQKLEKERAAQLAAQSELLNHPYRSSLTITASSTEELQTLQDSLEVDEQTVRELQADAGLKRLYPSRREEFINNVLQERIEKWAAERLDSERIQSEAKAQLGAVFDQDGGDVTLTWIQRDNGSFSKRSDAESPDMTVTIQDATTDISETVLPERMVDVVVLEDSVDVSVTSPVADQSLTLDRGAYTIHARWIRTLAQEAGLIETETREATCTSRDKDALDITVGETESDSAASVTELKSGSNGYSKRNTKGWTNYLDFDPDREMVLICVGQASFYGNSLRGKQERTWLVGRENEQVWTHQVYNTNHTIEAALEFMCPAEVQRFADEGRNVIRQGDVFFVEMLRSSNFDAISDTRHDVTRINDETVHITHPEHDDLDLTGPWKAILNNDASQS